MPQGLLPLCGLGRGTRLSTPTPAVSCWVHPAGGMEFALPVFSPVVSSSLLLAHKLQSHVSVCLVPEAGSEFQG